MATRKRDRFFARFGAILFLVTSSALTIAVIWSAVHGKSDAAQVACAQTSVAAQNAALPDVYKPPAAVTTLQKTDLTTGSGKTAKSGDCLVVQYYGTLARDGSVFDENFDKASAFQFQLGQGQVISGWDLGLVGMKVGGTRRLVIPASLAYGDQGAGAAIPPNADLVFVVKLLRIQS